MRASSHPGAQRRPSIAVAALALAFHAAVLASPARGQQAKQDSPQQAGQKIVDIEVVDNTKTTDATVILIANVEKGDRFSPDLVERIRIDLVNSGLFKEVDITWANTSGGVLLTISAKDKHSWVIAPTYYNQPTNQGGGAGFGENNLFGENKKLLLYGQVATGDTFFVGAYIDPSIKGTRFKWQVDAYLLRNRAIEYAAPTEFVADPKEVRISKLNYLNMGVTGGVKLFRNASMDLRLRGAKVFYDDVALAEGAMPEEVTGDPSTPADAIPEPGQEGYDVSAQLVLGYDWRANWYGISHGDRYQVSVERALTDLGSDFDYWHTRLYFERARKYFSSHNLIVKSQLTYGRDLPFQQEFKSGGTDLRGYLNQQLRGDFRVAVNAEYSMPLIGIKGVSLRVLGFFDTTYTAFLDIEDTDSFRSYLPDQGTLGLAPFKNTVGVGTRIFVRQIVLPLLGLDVGYGLERGDFEIYLAIGLTDV